MITSLLDYLAWSLVRAERVPKQARTIGFRLRPEQRMLVMMHYIKTLHDDQLVEFAFHGRVADTRRGKDFKNNEYKNLKAHWDDLKDKLDAAESAYAARQRRIREKFFLHFDPLNLRESYLDIDARGNIPEASALGDKIVDDGTMQHIPECMTNAQQSAITIDRIFLGVLLQRIVLLRTTRKTLMIWKLN